ncbi:4Fe-4S binding protein [Desulfovibrio sp. SGI.169]|uniref:4Fe-4S binding protein n=1 Tax=Desulfovibrio sp. SGI.169 TaxID=3420561 RepID=UPI003D05E8D2
MHLVFVSRQFNQKQDSLRNFPKDSLVLVVDVDRCIACGSCALACRAEHGTFGEQEKGARRLVTTAGPEQKMPRVVSLPTSCRHCSTPCDCDDGYNFWTLCPADRVEAVAVQTARCDECEQRLRQGMAPACASRCSMKCLYAGRPEDVRFALEEKRLRGMGETEIC